MIEKSYILEKNIQNVLKYKASLFYGVNVGLKKHFKKSIKLLNPNNIIINFNQEELLTKKDKLIEELNNKSLFGENKIIFIDNATDKLFSLIEGEIETLDANKIIFFSEILDKRSKLRNFFEKSKISLTVPCYEDNETTIKKIIKDKLNELKGLSTEHVSIIISHCGNDRIKLENEIEKIISCFNNEIVEKNKLETLLDAKINDDFNELKDAALSGNKLKTNRLLDDTVIDADKSSLYLSIINQRLERLKEVRNKVISGNIQKIIDELKPPVFWKDKPILTGQANIWNTNKINKVLTQTYGIEISTKSSHLLDKKTIIKKLIIDICNLANAA